MTRYGLVFQQFPYQLSPTVSPDQPRIPAISCVLRVRLLYCQTIAELWTPENVQFKRK
jgi:hypothetical protein